MPTRISRLETRVEEALRWHARLARSLEPRSRARARHCRGAAAGGSVVDGSAVGSRAVGASALCTVD